MIKTKNSIWLLLLVMMIDRANAQQVLFDFNDWKQLDLVEPTSVRISLDPTGRPGKLLLESDHLVEWPGITLKPENGLWDASEFQKLSFDIENTGDHAFEIGLRIDNPGSEDDQSKRFTVMSHVLPKQSKTITAAMNLTPWQFSKPLKLFGMHAAPGQANINPSNISQVIIFLRQPIQDHQFEISNIRFHGEMKQMEAENFLPFIDEYGQYAHEEWPGKTRSDADLFSQLSSEATDLNEHPGPKNFNEFGGLKDGPMLAPQKHFRTQNIDGKWWLIDPSGARFWSHGIDCVSWNFSSTGTDDREDYFQKLPSNDDKGAEFFFESSWGLGFYSSRVPYRMYNFLAANLSRKYGPAWEELFSAKAHQRLKSWGINTLASWSEPKICYQRKTPYTAFLRVEDCPVLAGAGKMWTQFADVYDPGFAPAILQSIKTNSEAIGDPWCIGFFVDNELFWGESHSLGLWTLQSPPDQAAKVRFIEQLRKRYDSIEALNQKWQANYSSWKDLASQSMAPNLDAAKDDLDQFSQEFSNTYFQQIKSALHKHAPGQLYLGCRFIWENPIAIRAACQHCDVVSFNCYRYSPTGLRLPAGEDKPIIIGEFHFGALDRGMFHPTRVPAKNQTERGRCYEAYVTDALKHPNIVGTHWFQYVSEATSGRGDGENYQVGFVDICDTPYTETVAAARKVGYRLYEIRIRKD